MPDADYIQKALLTYEKHRQSLIAQGVGRYALIRDEDISTWETYEDALKAGYVQYGIDGRFLVTKIHGPIDDIQHFSRDIGCPA